MVHNFFTNTVVIFKNTNLLPSSFFIKIYQGKGHKLPLIILILKTVTLQLLVGTQEVTLHLEAGPLPLVDPEVELEAEEEEEVEADLD